MVGVNAADLMVVCSLGVLVASVYVAVRGLEHVEWESEIDFTSLVSEGEESGKKAGKKKKKKKKRSR